MRKTKLSEAQGYVNLTVQGTLLFLSCCQPKTWHFFLLDALHNHLGVGTANGHLLFAANTESF